MAVAVFFADSQHGLPFAQQAPSGQQPATVLLFAVLPALVHDLQSVSLQHDMGCPASFAS
jgi:hypothetical protein